MLFVRAFLTPDLVSVHRQFLHTEGMRKLLTLVVVLILALAAGVTPAYAAVHTPTPPTVIDNGCGRAKSITAPTSTSAITYTTFQTTNGYFKVVAVVDTGDTFNLEGTGYVTTPIAPYRAEHQTQIITPCPATEPPAQHRPWWKVWRDWVRDCFRQWHRR